MKGMSERAFNGQPITVRRHTDRWTPNKGTGPVATAAYTVVRLVKTTALNVPTLLAAGSHNSTVEVTGRYLIET